MPGLGGEVADDFGCRGPEGWDCGMTGGILVGARGVNFLLAGCVRSSPGNGIKSRLERCCAIPLIGVAKLVVGEDNCVDQADKLVRIRAIKTGFIGGLGNGRTLASNDRFCLEQ